MIRTHLMALLLGAMLASQESQRASIEGVVVSGATGQPAAGVVVELSGVVAGRVRSYTTTTSKTGAFSIRSIPPGNDYALVAYPDAMYLPAQYGQQKPLGPGIPIMLAAGARTTGIRIELSPASSLDGRILSPAGDPFSNVTVAVTQLDYPNGRWALEAAYTAQTLTDLEGKYHFWLPPGKYCISAIPKPEKPKPGKRSQSFLPSYFPGTFEKQECVPVDLPLESDFRMPDFMALRALHRHLSGVVVDHAGNRVAARVTLTRLGASPLSPSIGVDSADGRFAFNDIASDSYVVSAWAMGAIRLIGGVVVDVSQADLQEISIPMSPGVNVAAQLAVRGRPAADSGLYDMTVMLQSDPPAFPPFVASRTGARWIFEGVAPGQWDYRVTTVPSGMVYVSSIRLGGIPAPSDSVRIASQHDGEMEIILATDFGAIDGVVLNSPKNDITPIRVVLAPAAPHGNDVDSYRVVTADATGQFHIEAVPPGDYKVFSWQSTSDSVLRNPEFIRLFEDRGTPVRVDGGGRQHIDVTLLPPWPTK